MSIYLFILILLTAVAHTTWNVLLKTSENKVLFLVRISRVAVLLNVGLSLASTLLPITGNKSLPFKQYDEMVDMLRHHKRKLFSSSVLVALVAAGSVLFLPLLLEHVEFLR